MFTLTAFSGTLPPASLAKADLPEFVSRALRRRLTRELSDLKRMLGDETLSGYPLGLGPVLSAVIERIDAARLDPADLDPATARQLMSSPEFIRTVAKRVEVDRVILRPGTPVIGEVRVLLDGRVVTVAGEGSQLVLLGPVELVRLHSLGWTALRSVPLVRLMDTDEAARIRDLWAIIEERVSWPSDVGRHWEARFVDVASRSNDRVDLCADWLRELTPLQRREVWRELLEHLRDQELPESHRPFQRALGGRLEALGLDVPPEVQVALSSIGIAAYESCAYDPWVERGYCTCSQADIERYAEWVEVPSGTRQRLQTLSPAVISHHLRTLAASEEGLLQADLEAESVRDLRGFRDAYLCVRYRRNVSSVLGTDPLTLAEDRLQRGFDKGCILDELERLAAAASPDLDAPSLVPELPTPEPVAPREYTTAPPDEGEEAMRRRSTPLRPETYPEVPPETDLPPLPRPPPPRERPTTRRRMELPPLPEVPPARPPSRTNLERVGASRPSTPPPAPPEPVAPAPPRERIPTSPYLVTPNQGSRFYETAFHELQVLERDLLERGSWPEAEERIRVLTNEAEELATSLGPSARSGDVVFQKALHKVELVRSYLGRIQPLTQRPVPFPQSPPPEETEVESDEPGVLNRLGRLLRGED